MDTRGGFELPREGAPLPPPPHAPGAEQHDGSSAPQPERALTDRQQTRLSAYLDDALTAISRGFLRRHEPRPAHPPAAEGKQQPQQQQHHEHHGLPTLPALLAAWARILTLVVRIPPVGSSASLLVSYLLRSTSDLTEDIVGYNLGEDTAVSLDDQLHAALALLDSLDHLWADLLRGYPIKQHEPVFAHFRTGTASHSSEADTTGIQHPAGLSTDPSGRFHHVPPASAGSTRRHTALLHSFPPPPNTPHRPHQHSDPASHTSVLSQTERIRLRNLALLARDRLFRWMRDVLDAPPPPEIEESAADRRSQSGASAADGAAGHGSRVAALLDLDRRQQGLRASTKRRRVERGHGAEDDATLDEQEREFAALAGEQGDLDAGLAPLRDEPVDEAQDDGGHLDQGSKEQAAGGQEAEDGIPEMVSVIDEEDDAPPTGGPAALRELGTGGDGDRAFREEADGNTEEPGQLGAEHRHYADLFSRKLDPDASDDEEDGDKEERRGDEDHNAEQGQGPSRNGKRARSRSGSIDSADAHTVLAGGADDGPTANTNGNGAVSHAVVGQWDLEFSRCFRRTLRLLAESDDRARAREREEQQENAQGDD